MNTFALLPCELIMLCRRFVFRIQLLFVSLAVVISTTLLAQLAQNTEQHMQR